MYLQGAFALLTSKRMLILRKHPLYFTSHFRKERLRQTHLRPVSNLPQNEARTGSPLLLTQRPKQTEMGKLNHSERTSRTGGGTAGWFCITLLARGRKAGGITCKTLAHHYDVQLLCNILMTALKNIMGIPMMNSGSQDNAVHLREMYKIKAFHTF